MAAAPASAFAARPWSGAGDQVNREALVGGLNCDEEDAPPPGSAPRLRATGTAPEAPF